MACNTCHPHPPIDGNLGYSELWVAVNNAFYEAREAIEKYTKAESVTDGPSGAIPRFPETLPTEADGDGVKFIAKEGGFGLELGPFEALIGGSFEFENQFYAARLGYSLNEYCKIVLGWNHTGAGSNSDIFGVENSGGSSMIPGIYTDGYWINGRGGAIYVEGYFGDDVMNSYATDTFWLSCEVNF